MDKVKEFIKENKWFLTVIIAAIAFRICFTPVTVKGHSMDNTLYDTEIGLVNKLDKSPARGDIVVATNPVSGDHIIKRVIGVPGDEIRSMDGYVYVNDRLLVEEYLDDSNKGVTYIDKEIVLGEGEYYLLGDNRQKSADSRKYGAYTRESLVGTWMFRVPLISP